MKNLLGLFCLFTCSLSTKLDFSNDVLTKSEILPRDILDEVRQLQEEMLERQMEITLMRGDIEDLQLANAQLIVANEELQQSNEKLSQDLQQLKIDHTNDVQILANEDDSLEKLTVENKELIDESKLDIATNNKSIETNQLQIQDQGQVIESLVEAILNMTTDTFFARVDGTLYWSQGDLQSRDEAKSACSSYGGRLWEPTSAQEQDEIILALLGSAKNVKGDIAGVWLGIQWRGDSWTYDSNGQPLQWSPNIGVQNAECNFCLFCRCPVLIVWDYVNQENHYWCQSSCVQDRAFPLCEFKL